MPRPNAMRSIASERALAARIAYERDARGMSYEGLAARMTAIGCAINASAIYKIEKGEPPRRITVDELVALGRVFKLELEELVQPPEVAANKQLLRLLRNMQNAADATLQADGEYKTALNALAKFAEDQPSVVASLESTSDFRLADVLDTLTGIDTETDAESGARKKRARARRKAEV